MKEEEAKNKCCPFRGMFGENERTGESYYSDGRCIGTDCMMWRYSHEKHDHGDCGLKNPVIKP